MNGILVVDKPKGMTSQQVVGRVKRMLGVKKVGHTGTLDPEVDGVLPLCIGSATRIAEYMLDQSKAYIGEVTFGFSTDTQDATGEVLQRVDAVHLTEDQVRQAFSRFQGQIEQVPSAFSAIKVGGKRAYDLARKGESVVIPPRTVTIYRLDIMEFFLNQKYPAVRFFVECSKGTYIRTLCHDLGSHLQIPAHMSALTRVKSGPFSLDKAHTLDQIESAQAAGTAENLLLSPSVAVLHFPVYAVSEQQVRRVTNGMEMTFPAGGRTWQTGAKIRVEDRAGKLLAIYQVMTFTDKEIHTKPEKVFKE